MVNYNSFNYVLSSQDKINMDATYYELMFGGFNSQYNDYHVEVIGLVISNINVLDYTMMTASNLSYDGYFCRNILGSDTCILANISAESIPQMTSNGSSFTVKNCRVPRLVTFKFLNADFTELIDGVDINVEAQSNWLLTLKMTPIE